MKIEPKFYQNFPDDNHCLQASVKMVLDTLGQEISWDEIDSGTQYESGLNTWTVAGAIYMAKKIRGVRFFSSLDYEKFAGEGEDYLKEYWTPSWYEGQKKKSSPGFDKERALARALIQCKIWQKESLAVEKIKELLSDFLLITLVDAGGLKGQKNNIGHFVLVYATTHVSFLVHDPGLPPLPFQSIPEERFKIAFDGSDAILVPNNSIPFGSTIGVNDPCFCKSGKKFKKCHGT